MKYRGRYEVFATMLEAANSEKDTSRTIIRYKAFLSYIQLKDNLALLLENGLIKKFYKDGKAVYKPTDKGKRFLSLYNEINNSIS
jgi:predicted transcriptional regulator